MRQQITSMAVYLASNQAFVLVMGYKCIVGGPTRVTYHHDGHNIVCRNTRGSLLVNRHEQSTATSIKENAGLAVSMNLMFLVIK